MITGKTIAQLDLILSPTDNLSIPVDNGGSTNRILFSGITAKINSQGLNTLSTGSYSHAEGNNTIASGNYSHAEGSGSVSLGLASHAEGSQTSSVGDYSHSEGQLTSSNGESSHAEGNQTTSTGDFSHSEGTITISYGNNSHSEGNGSISSGDSSHAEGVATSTLGFGSHSEGLSSVAVGDGSHAEGNTNYSIGNYSHVEGYNNTSGWRGYNVSSAVGYGLSIFSTSDLTNLFTSGKVILDDNILSYSSTSYVNQYFNLGMTENLNNASVQSLTYSAINPSSFTVIYSDGDDVYVNVPFPEGFSCNFLNVSYSSVSISSNAYLTFGGGSSQCCFSIPGGIPSIGLPGIYLNIFGMDGILNTLYTGYTNSNQNYVLRFEGTYRLLPQSPPDLIINFVFDLINPNTIDIIVESNPLNEGDSGVADALTPTFLGTFNASSGTAFRITTNDIFYGYVNDIDNIRNLNLSSVNGNFTHSEGFNTIAFSRGSHSEGANTLSVGQYSHAEGVGTTAIGYGSHSSGLGTISTRDYQTSVGSYNTSGNTTSLFVVGNGTGDTSRSDIVLVQTTGMTVNGQMTTTGKTVTNTLRVTGVSEYADNAAAIAGGLVTGDLYRTGDTLKIVH
jgi:hypothetical protein